MSRVRFVVVDVDAMHKLRVFFSLLSLSVRREIVRRPAAAGLCEARFEPNQPSSKSGLLTGNEVYTSTIEVLLCCLRFYFE